MDPNTLVPVDGWDPAFFAFIDEVYEAMQLQAALEEAALIEEGLEEPKQKQKQRRL